MPIKTRVQNFLEKNDQNAYVDGIQEYRNLMIICYCMQNIYIYKKVNERPKTCADESKDKGKNKQRRRLELI